MIVDEDGEQTLVMPAIALYLVGIPTRAAVAFRIPPHARPSVYKVSWRMESANSPSVSSGSCLSR